MDALQVKNLTKAFGGVRAVDGLSLSFKWGSITGVVGPNGSGKTTLTNLLTGIVPLDGGSVVIGGTHERARVRSRDVFSLGITRTFQNVRVFEHMSVLDNVLVALTSRTVVPALFEQRVAAHESEAQAILERVTLWGKRHALAHTLSYGERKLLEIARALATKADIYLFDEPYAGLFPEIVKLISGIMRELKNEGKTVILIEHDMALIRELCDHVIVMDAGKVLAEGRPDQVLKDPKVIEAYLGV